MSKICFFCEKGTTSGGHRRHKYGGGWEYRAPRTTRKLKPNIRKAKIEKEGKIMTVDVCMKCYKKLRKSAK
ncbi:MAG: L28 family ribosomal protein [Candidatus Dojkabacteria bacterium]|nr:L28 family ribosomal protein [Candidatus Dojkabacteria bacterium]